MKGVRQGAHLSSVVRRPGHANKKGTPGGIDIPLQRLHRNETARQSTPRHSSGCRLRESVSSLNFRRIPLSQRGPSATLPARPPDFRCTRLPCRSLAHASATRAREGTVSARFADPVRYQIVKDHSPGGAARRRDDEYSSRRVSLYPSRVRVGRCLGNVHILSSVRTDKNTSADVTCSSQDDRARYCGAKCQVDTAGQAGSRLGCPIQHVDFRPRQPAPLAIRNQVVLQCDLGRRAPGMTIDQVRGQRFPDARRAE